MTTQASLFDQPISNSPLITFRIVFGLVMVAEAIAELTFGFVRVSFIEIRHNFAFMGFEWLHVLHGPVMYLYFVVLLLAALGVATGFCYRFSSLLVALLWTAFYLCQKTHYNNHYYLLVLLSWLMVVMPANRRFSLDVRLRGTTPSNIWWYWQWLLLVFQVGCLYVFAAIAKMNSDWLHAVPLSTWMQHKTGIPMVGHFMRWWLAPWLVAYGGLLFDLLVIPGLLYRRSRPYFLALSVLFHLLNGLLFHIGTFPYLAIGLNVFFISPVYLDRFLPSSVVYSNEMLPGKSYRWWLLYVLLQLWLPMRHWFIPGDVAWTDEGYRMSWQMMLRNKWGEIYFTVVDKKTVTSWQVTPQQFLHKVQVPKVSTLPDITWQAAQYLAQLYRLQGKDVAIYAHDMVSVNYCPPRLLIDSTVNLATTKWNYWGHNEFVIGGK